MPLNSEAQAIVSAYIINLEISKELVLKLYSEGADTNTLRHSATNYDEIWKAIQDKGGKGSQKAIKTIGNQVNNRIASIIRVHTQSEITLKDAKISELEAQVVFLQAELAFAKAEAALQQVKEVYHCPEEYVFHGEFQW